MTFSQHKVLLGVIVLLHWKCKEKKNCHQLPQVTPSSPSGCFILLIIRVLIPVIRHISLRVKVAIVTALVIVIDLCIFFNRDLPVAKENRFSGDDVVARMGHRVLTNLYRVASKPAVILSTSYLSCKECTGCATEVNK